MKILVNKKRIDQMVGAGMTDNEILEMYPAIDPVILQEHIDEMREQYGTV